VQPKVRTRQVPAGVSGLVRADPHEASVSPLELLIDLVFVFSRIAAAACLSLIPVATSAGGIATLATLLAVTVLLIAYEVVRDADARARIRAERIGH
jgi:low temperature requirement protein LtrA